MLCYIWLHFVMNRKSLTHSPLSRPCGSTSLLPLVTSSVLMIKDNFVRLRVQSEEIFQTIRERAQSSQGRGKRQKNHVKVPWKSCSTPQLPFLSPNPKILHALLKTFPTKIKPSKCPAKEKKWGKKSVKRREGRREILLFVHARTSQADILQLDEKAAKCTSCKLFCGTF